MCRVAGWGGLVVVSLLLILGAECASTGPGTASGLDPSDPNFETAEAIVAAAAVGRDGAATFEQGVAAGADDPIGDTIAALRARADVASVELSIDGATIMVEHVDGQRIAILTDQKDRAEWELAPNPTAKAATTAATAGGSAIICNEKSFPQSKQALVITGFQQDFDTDLNTITGPLQRAGYQPDVLRLSTPADLEQLQNKLANAGVIYMSSHGNVSKNLDGVYGNNVVTEIEVPLNDSEAFADSLLDMVAIFGGDFQRFVSVSANKGKLYWSLTPAFFGQFKYPNSFVYVDSCNSDHDVEGGNQLASAFTSNGAGAFVGWKGKISTRFSNPAAAAIFDGMAPQTATISSVDLSTNPSDPGAGESYVPTAVVSPASTGVEIQISISGTDGFARTETGTTDAAGEVVFSSVPGGASGVVDTITEVAGGADSSASAVNVVQNDPTLNQVWQLPYNPKQETLSNLSLTANSDYNIICNNQAVTQTTKLVKF
ncbi:MAG: hypothetical protein HY718_11100 [Planctomycetes bacterium]|nr:hypothetical protein [Planctomycetota bacterium]